jgi:UDP-N-acetylmuramoyl-tripeptide--D-alanyl-D-alanine ligase
MTATAFAWTDLEVRTALGLRTDQARADVVYEGVTTDSRNTRPNQLYVALQGERFDGHDFVGDAVGAGATGVVVSHPVAGEGRAILYPVADTLVALGRLAAHRRRALAARVVAITGSSGKTSTKDFVRAALSDAHRVHATPGNLNNRVGVPLTLLSAPDGADVLVVELGTNEPGEIATLTAIVRPDLGVVVTVGASHLEKLGSLAGVLDEKLDLLRGLAPGGQAVVGDRPAVLPERARTIVPSVRVAGWTDAADPDLRPGDVEVDAWGCHTFTFRGARVRLAVAGRHAVQNALVALTVAGLLGVGPEDAARGLANIKAGKLRGEIRRFGDLTLVVDCYNANPQSVEAALDLLEARSVGSGRVAFLGSMLELGEHEAELHREVLAGALARGLDGVVATGLFSAAAETLGSRPQGGTELMIEPDPDRAYQALRPRLSGGEVVLLKASRGVQLERLVPRFEADFGGADQKAEA